MRRGDWLKVTQPVRPELQAPYSQHPAATTTHTRRSPSSPKDKAAKGLIDWRGGVVGGKGEVAWSQGAMGPLGEHPVTTLHRPA